MADRGTFPRAYKNSVPTVDGGDSTPPMVYTTFPRMGIGARRSGMPDRASDPGMSLDHVGMNATKGAK